MAALDPKISPKDAKAIADAHAKFLDSRTAMADGLKKKLDSPWRRALIIDSIIAGTVAHLVEVGRDQANHAEELKQIGGGKFDAFVSSITDSTIMLFQKDIAG